ncbi:threonine synthase-like 2 [Nematostella vectensis]|uniref:threonine synthase-like 2 n=1 Tax=Nematostella vectensis TaxID=45351 RepID=UPI002077526F|nr:threonine synthase-like 2 [Nematostella vectensis]
MKFNSTRGKVKGLSFEEAIFTGYALDGGLLLPQAIPKLEIKILKEWATLSYKELCYEILSLFVSEEEVLRHDLKEIISKAYCESKFPNKNICNLTRLDNNLHILELFHGKTKAFKDNALVLVAAFLDFFLGRKKRHTTILVGTSGDTGSAAIESIRGLALIDIVVLFPKGYCNTIQELQMTTVIEDNVHVFECEGSSDDLDIPVKKCLTDEGLVTKYNLGSINSINIGRLLAQIVFYFYAYFKVCKEVGSIVKFVVPTGAMGNITAGYVAYNMGLPLKLHAAVNDNNIVHRMISQGDFSLAESITKTWSPAMDIQMPYNMERMWLIASDFNYDLVSSLTQTFEEHSAVTSFPETLTNKLKIVVSSDWVSREATLDTMRRAWDSYHYLVCPHTAVGLRLALQKRDAEDDGTPVVCVATASPDKFPEAVKAAGIDVPPSPDILRLAEMPTRREFMRQGEDWEKILRDKIAKIG